MKDSRHLLAIDGTRVVSYAALAAEYYDERRHPTSSNFREASARILEDWLQRLPRRASLTCEVGTGASLWAELLARRGRGLRELLGTDSSLAMLQHSNGWMAHGLRLIVSQAQKLPICDESLDLVVSSLGDPYNEPSFWREVSRVLRPGGWCLFTTPSYEWAMTFRSEIAQGGTMAAEFELADGRTVLVPSWIYSTDEQIRLIESHDLDVVEVVHVSRSAFVRGHLSRKLLVGEGPDLYIVGGYLVGKGLHP